MYTDRHTSLCIYVNIVNTFILFDRQWHLLVSCPKLGTDLEAKALLFQPQLNALTLPLPWVHVLLGVWCAITGLHVLNLCVTGRDGNNWINAYFMSYAVSWWYVEVFFHFSMDTPSMANYPCSRTAAPTFQTCFPQAPTQRHLGADCRRWVTGTEPCWWLMINYFYKSNLVQIPCLYRSSCLPVFSRLLTTLY